MNTIIRAYIKNAERLSGLRREFVSWNKQKLYKLGSLNVVDDFSPMQEELVDLCKEFGVNYRLASGISDTKNGLIESLKLGLELDSKPALHCVDDAVFGNGILDRLLQLEEGLPRLNNYACVGLFACYDPLVRTQSTKQELNLWRVSNDILYALVSHVFSAEFSRIMIGRWDRMLLKLDAIPPYQDDIWVAKVSKELGLDCYNTILDYAQHTGIHNRTFEDVQSSNSEYQSTVFTGE